VIIPTIREDKLLDFQLPSFAKQSFLKEEFEIIIIDDCTVDRKDSILDFGKKNGLNIKWMRSKLIHYRSQAQIGNARNTGLIHAQGELIIFIDDFSAVRPKYLETVWSIYQQNPGYSFIGPVIAVEYGNFDINNLKVLNNDTRSIFTYNYGIKDYTYKPIYKEHRLKSFPCSSGWFYTSNASAPLEKIIQVNGFWEIADLTREEDILMGLALERMGWKFCFVDEPDSSVYHMVHGSSTYKKYIDVTYDSLGWPTVDINGRMVEGGGNGGRCGLNTNPDNIQLVTKDVFNTTYPGSWALTEHFTKNPGLIFNEEIGFNLAEERKKKIT
jgi:glycosyltransferase involved in cell wall biosynthesis